MSKPILRVRDNNGKVSEVRAIKGDQGDPGLTPYIHDNGNWWIGGTDTGAKADFTKNGYSRGHYNFENMAALEAHLYTLIENMAARSRAHFTWVGSTSATSDGIPFNTSNWFVTVDKLHENMYASVEMHTFYQGMSARNILENGVWIGWEWITPPMIAGVEYRTTERYNGKAVYALLVNCGNMPNATMKSIALPSIPKHAKIASQDVTYYSVGIGDSGEEMIMRYDSPLVHSCSVTMHHWLNSLDHDYQMLFFSTDRDYSYITAHATIKYTKE